MRQHRRCNICGKWYLRRNLTEQWVERNPGKKEGWKKQIMKVCLHCQSKQISQRIMVMAATFKIGGK